MSKEEEKQFGLIYDSAITENVEGKVNIHPVNYMLNGLKISANVYTPANFDENQKYPAVVVAHPNGGVKEQVAGLYSQKLAELGYITMAFDAAYQGQSEGEPRNTDKPQNRVEDIHGAIDYIVNYKGVDRARVGILGICGGGGYTLRAAQTDKRIKAVSTLSAFNTGIVRKNGFLDSQINTITERLEEAYKDAMRRLTGTKNKELFLIDGATHIKTYWYPEYVEKITNKLEEFFAKYL